MITTLPDFTPHGYRAVKELGRNTAGFRTTYQGVDISSNKLVVIKHFEVLPKNVDDWNTLNKMYDEEIQALEGLKHPNIPYFIKSFQLEDSSRCIALEYKGGKTLAETRSFSPDEVKSIAVSLLEILVYLQDQVPSIKHRDIKPENILVDDVNNSLEVHLVDFGFARIGDGEARTFSSTIKGTFGFMAPEQFQNKSLSNSSDLYGLGATLICLLTGTESSEINKLTNNYNYIKFKKLAPGLSLLFIKWLEKMVEPDPSNRYSNAKIALKELKPLYVKRVPEAVISATVLEFRATKIGEKISQSISISNSISDTVLEGIWEVVSHPNDLQGTKESHSWISFKSRKFSGNSVECKVIVDTAKLMASKTYKRQVTLHSNSLMENQVINIIVHTDSLPIEVKTPPYWFIFLSFVSPLLVSSIPIIIWACISPLLSAYDNTYSSPHFRSKDWIIYGAIGGPITLGLIFVGFAFTAFILVPLFWLACSACFSPNCSNCNGLNASGGYLSALIQAFLCSLLGASITWGSPIWMPSILSIFSDMRDLYVNAISEKQISLLEWLFASFTPFVFGASLIIVFSRLDIAEFAKISTALSGAILLGYLLFPSMLRQIKISKYRASEKKLIKP